MVAVDFGGFSEIVDMLGGVSITLTEAEAEELRLSPGQQTLGGEKALEYARLRSIDSDFHRTNRQRTVLISLLEQHRDLSPLDLHRVLSACLSLTSTNLTDSQILSYATELFPLLRKLNVESGSVPLDGQYTEAVVADREVLIPDLPAITATLHEITQE
jgi:anionic cell wall polymer biosynthesis LytR-Cps2A-Psr (LCP) family protein